MQLISDEYRKLNKKLHETNAGYGAIGGEHVERILNLCKLYNTKDILDYGCGKGTLAINFPFNIHQYDPAVEQHSALPEPADILACTDVLEHIEPEYIANVLDHISSLIKKVAYFVISISPAKKHLPDGRNAHILLRPANWWLDEFNKRFDVLNFMKSDMGCYFLVEPKKEFNHGGEVHPESDKEAKCA